MCESSEGVGVRMPLCCSPHSYDVVMTMGQKEILEKFRDFDCRVVFSAESFCWPDQSLVVRSEEQ